MSRALRPYVWTVAALGAGPLVWSVHALATQPPDARWILLAVLTVITGTFRIRVPSVKATVSVSDGFVFASTLLFGPAAVTVTVALDGLLVSWRNRDRTLLRTAFNVFEPAVSVWTAAQLYSTLSGAAPLADAARPVGSLILPTFAMTTAYFVLNTGLTAVAVTLETGEAVGPFLRKHLPHVGLNYLASVCILTILVPNASSIDVVATGVTVPLLVMSYVSAKTTMTHIEESNRHLSDMNRLYLRIVETLAVAIDAKDQVTHGHIRRVQAQTVALARSLGVTDPQQIQAIEAAGLLHDLGKLAVPEHILNKPGPLTLAEMEQMKSHASVGAAILSTIDFPHPVVPIVRHHHESWDGSGYPDGLAGEAIPLGARILAVVDCFDALTSDRPYRRRLSDEEALRLIAGRRGTMYDPAVVDAFVRHFAALPHAANSGNDPLVATILREGRSPSQRTASNAASGPRSSRTARDLELEAQSLGPCVAREPSITGVGDRVADFVRRVSPESMCVLYTHDQDADELRAAYVSSPTYRRLGGHRVRMGNGVSGWVAANQQTITNADATLDLGDDAGTTGPQLRVCVAAPLATRPQVLAVYTSDPRGFSTDQCRLIEVAAKHLHLPTGATAPPAQADSADVVRPFPRAVRL